MTESLGPAVDELLKEQQVEWPALAKGVNGLAAAETRTVKAAGLDVLVRHIPHRVTSTTAPVDQESIQKRPCFLCPENLDPRQKGLAFGDTHLVYGNPFPIVDRHLTIVHREHRPQRIDEQAGVMLDLAAALPGSFVLYNGPECGASAPDHLHLQAGSRQGLPIARDTANMSGPAIERYGGRALLFRGNDRAQLLDQTNRALEALSAVTGRQPEPWCNLLVFSWSPRPGPDAQRPSPVWVVVIFPRGKHRPDVFHRGELTVSPAAIDLGGILVTPLRKDFETISGDQIAEIYREVCLPDDAFRDVVSRLESGASR